VLRLVRFHLTTSTLSSPSTFEVFNCASCISCKCVQHTFATDNRKSFLYHQFSFPCQHIYLHWYYICTRWIFFQHVLKHRCSLDKALVKSFLLPFYNTGMYLWSKSKNWRVWVLQSNVHHNINPKPNPRSGYVTTCLCTTIICGPQSVLKQICQKSVLFHTVIEVYEISKFFCILQISMQI
jgi:hypothetical protein